MQGDKARPLLAPEELFLTDEAFFTAAKGYGRLALNAKNADAAGKLPNVAVNRRSDEPLGALKNHLATFKGRVLLVAETAGRRETLAAMFAEHGLKPAVSADLAGFLASDAKLALGIGPLQAVLRWTIWLSSPKPSCSPARPAAHGARRRRKPLSTTG